MASTMAETCVRAGIVAKRTLYAAGTGFRGDLDYEKGTLKVMWQPPIGSAKATSVSYVFDLPGLNRSESPKPTISAKPAATAQRLDDKGQASDFKISRSSSVCSTTPAYPNARLVTRSTIQTSASSLGEFNDTGAPEKLRSNYSWPSQRRALPVPNPFEPPSRKAIQQRVNPNSAGLVAQATMSLVAAQGLRQRSLQRAHAARPSRVPPKAQTSLGIAT